MATCRDQIEHLERKWSKNLETWKRKNLSHSRKWLKKQMNKFIRKKPIEEDEVGLKTNKKPTKGWEY